MPTHCDGKLILHRDGTVALCTAQLTGPGCPDLSLAGHATFLSCADVLGAGVTCPRCGPVPGPVRPVLSGVEAP